MGYRKFRLVNSIGETYELTDKNYKHFLYQPKGLGYNKELSGIRLGNRVKVNGRTYDMPSPSGEMIFYEVNPEGIYDDYNEFMLFLSHSPVKLYYYTPGNNKSEEEANSIYLECEDISVEKNDINPEDGCLHCPITFTGLTFWLKGGQPSDLVIRKTQEEAGDFTFPLSFPFSFGQDSLKNIELISNGTLTTPIILTIDGRCVDPYIRFYQKINNEYIEYGAAKLIGTFDNVSIDGNDNVQSIFLMRDGEVLTNGADYQDMTVGVPGDDFFLTFLKLKPGKTYATISFAEENFEGEVHFIWRDEYYSY